MTKYDRLLYILNLLRSRKNLNAEHLAEECGVTERTIYRDIVSLSEANIPIYYDNGYKYASGNFLPPLNFNIDEYLVLRKILESSPLAKSDDYRKLIKSIKSKIDAGLSPNVKEQKFYSAGAADVKIKSTHSDKFSSEYFAVVEKGIKQNRLLEMKYDSVESGEMSRTVEPYFLIFIERAFYFVGYCYSRKSLRTFRIDRIVDIALTETNFKTRENINPSEYFENSWGVYSGKPEKIEVIFSGKAARIVSLSKHHKNERITYLKDGRVKYSVTVAGYEEIYRWLMGFAGDAVVEKPDRLAKKIKKAAQDILKNY